MDIAAVFATGEANEWRTTENEQPHSDTQTQKSYDDYARISGQVLPHQSNLPQSAHSREGYYPDGIEPTVHRPKQSQYSENRDQPYSGRIQPQNASPVYGDALPLHMQLTENHHHSHRRQPVARRASNQHIAKGDQPYPKQPVDEERLEAQRKHVEQFNLTRLFPALRFKRPNESIPGVQRLHNPAHRIRRSSPNSPKRLMAPHSPPHTARDPSSQALASFNPHSPISNFNHLRSAEADGMMSTLSPRTHHRAVQAYQQQQHGAISPYHPSIAGRPGTSPLTGSYPHRQPFRPCNPAEARSVFKAATHGPFLGATGEYVPPSSIQFRPNTNGGSMRFKTAASVKAAAETTMVDYYLNSPDEHVKKLERLWTREQAELNRKQFLQQLNEQQQAERRRLYERNVKDGRIHISESLPSRPLAFSR